MTIQEYFERSDTPQAGSPVGLLMVKILEKNPMLGYEEARAEAYRLLERAAAGKNYRTPKVLSPEEKVEAANRLKAAFPAAAITLLATQITPEPTR